jgi:hypothetical protein
MMRALWAKLFGRARSGPSGQNRVPEFECLEGRLVPQAGAVRSIPGFHNFLLAPGDEISAKANIGFTVNFYGNRTNTLFVNTDGNVTFYAPLDVFISRVFPIGLGQPILAPFWADVDTTGAPGKGSLTNTVTFGTGTLEGHKAFAATWTQVGFNTAHTAPNDTFQVVLIDRSDTGAGNFDIEFNYNGILWDSSDTMGGTTGLASIPPAAAGSRAIAASVGWSAGTNAPRTAFVLPNSGKVSADPFIDSNLATGLTHHDKNANTPGRYHFFIRNGASAGTNTDITNSTSVYLPYRYVYNAATQAFTGNLTLVNRTFPLAEVIASNIALDEPVPVLGTIPAMTTVTVLFTQLPPGVVVANATGVTGNGLPYIQTTAPVPFGITNSLRLPLAFLDPLHLALPNFFASFGIHVFIGQFNPSLL